MTIPTETILACVSPKTLDKVSRLFDASLTDILNELFQNARRAGATRLDLAATATHLSIVDDAKGIAEPQTLLSFGDSDWDSAVHQEDPAGMGFFSLASRGVTVSSHNWSVGLLPQHFSGACSAVVEPGEWRSGTQLDIPITPQEWQYLEASVAYAAKFYPLPVYFEGREMPRCDFLESALYQEDWCGLRLGVFRGGQPCDRVDLNFYGLRVKGRLPVLMDDHVTFSIKVDVVHCPQLQLVLPARKECVQDDFYRSLTQAVWRTFYRYIQSIGSHSLSFRHWQRAQELGVNLPEAKAELSPYTPAIAFAEDREWRSPEALPDLVVVMQLEASAAVQQSFWRAVQGANLPYRLVESNDNYKGYVWYDRLPLLEQVRCEVLQQGQWVAVETLWNPEKPTYQSLNFEVEALRYGAIVQHSDGRQEEFWCDGEVYLGEQDCSGLEGSIVVITAPRSIAVEELVELLQASYFYPHEDGDTALTQQDDFQEEATELAIRLLLNEEEAWKTRLQMSFDRHVRWLIPTTVTVQVVAQHDQTEIAIVQ